MVMQLVDVDTGEMKSVRFRSTLTSKGDGTELEYNSGIPSVPIDEKGYTDLGELYLRCLRLPPEQQKRLLDPEINQDYDVNGGSDDFDYSDDMSDVSDFADASVRAADWLASKKESLTKVESSLSSKKEENKSDVELSTTDERGASSPKEQSDE